MIDIKNKVVMSLMAYDLQGNQILKIAYEVRDLKAKGEPIGDFTIGDFHGKEFAIPDELRDRIKLNYDEGYTNYPPSMGTIELRKAVAQLYSNKLGVPTQPEEVLVASGTRPLIFAAYAAVIDPGDMVIYGAPSWNNNHYCHIMGAFAEDIVTTPANNFMLTEDAIAPHLDRVVLVALNSPQNPSGTMMDPEELYEICRLIYTENQKRLRRGAKPCYVLYDQVYWMLTHGKKHAHPVDVVPEMKDFCIYTDGASKNFAGTGLRVGWAVIPPHLVEPMTNIIAHMGAWAPKAEQLALASYLPMEEVVKEYVAGLQKEMKDRLQKVHNTMQELKDAGLPVDSFEPQGGLFLSLFLGLKGYLTPNGDMLKTTEDIRRYVLHEGKCAFVPFEAFGDNDNIGWFRASVSGIARQELIDSLEQLKKALKALKLPTKAS